MQKLTAKVYDKKGKLLSIGQNSYSKTHPLQAKYASRAEQPERVFLHAEIAALVKCRGVPYRIKIERRLKDGSLGLSKPCPVCEIAIREAGIRIVEYSI